MKSRVLFITPSLTKGGAETQLIKVARFLNSKQFNVMIISLKPIHQFQHLKLEEEGIKVLLLDNWPGRFTSNVRMLYKAVRLFRAEIVVAFMFIAIIFARILKLFLGFKLVSTIRISVIKPKWYIPFKLTSVLDDIIVYNSKASKFNFENKRLVNKPGIVIYNGITIPEWNSPEAENHDKTFVWICIGHFKYNKDYPTLFKAVSRLKDHNFRVDILGRYDDQEWPFKMIEELGIENNVRLLGFRPNATDYLKTGDAFVLSSYSEGMPNGILEAMAYGKPIVATNIDGNNELLTEAECGFLSLPSDPEDLAAKMLEVMQMPPARRFVLGNNGRKFISTNFAEEKVMLDWLNLIQDYKTEDLLLKQLA
ncbi:glycosyltransferase [Desertivirga arenae]|uniref:glycosyltransferase n=1 Tax=Desertivirga arenae TaxID=2810309 RepID=UPI001A96F6CA|nr:glycosyltransferase [Pedobacter sp. SYSU D00823]